MHLVNFNIVLNRKCLKTNLSLLNKSLPLFSLAVFITGSKNQQQIYYGPLSQIKTTMPLGNANANYTMNVFARVIDSRGAAQIVSFGIYQVNCFIWHLLGELFHLVFITQTVSVCIFQVNCIIWHLLDILQATIIRYNY